MAFPPNFTNVWDVTFPPDTQLANLLGQDLRNFRTDVMQRLSLLSGTLINRPTPEILNATWGGAGFGLLYFATDTNQVFQWNGAAWVDVSNSVGGGKLKSEGSNVIPVTVANTVAQTNLQTLNVAANDIGAGQAFYIDSIGIIGSGGTGDTILLGVYLDAVLLGQANLSLAVANNQPWKLHATFAGLTVGVAGTVTGAFVEWCSSISGGSGGSADVGGMSIMVSNATGAASPPASVVIDTTVAHTLAIKATWSNARVTDTITSNFMNCYRIG